MKRTLVMGLMLVLITLIIGCGEKTDENELMEAENLVEGLVMLLAITNVDAFSGSSVLLAPPPFWAGPDTVPNAPAEWINNVFYTFTFTKFPVDSTGVTIDSAALLLMFTPDIWAHPESLPPTQMDVALLADLRNIWFHSIVGIPDSLHVAGDMKWNWDETWYNYAYNMARIEYGDSSGEITITTSTNIGLSAHFLFDQYGAGGPADNWGKFYDIKFVQFTFFAAPDPEGYDGYYELLSEGWKIRHYFKLERKVQT